MLHRNGTPPAPHPSGGAVPYERSRTAFLPDLPVAGRDALLYHLHRQQILGIPSARWLYLLLAAGGFLWAMGGLPGGWWATAIGLTAALALGLALWQAKRHGFVRFLTGDLPAVKPLPLAPSHKVAVYASGKLAVEGKIRLFAGLPGFYRTFATREHALLCQVRPRRCGPGRWPGDEEGLWYCFFVPEALRSIRAGILTFSQSPLPALAIDYRTVAVAGRRQGPKLAEIETLFLAFATEDERAAVLADLLADRPRLSPPLHSEQGQLPK